MNENKLHKNLQEQPKSPEVKRISKLHLLVHPGFITEEDIKEAEVDEEDLRLGAELFESYIKKAKGLNHLSLNCFRDEIRQQKTGEGLFRYNSQN